MSILGTIEGHGQLLAGDKRLGRVGYSISVSQSGTTRRASGYITGAESVLIPASMAGGIILLLEGGQTVDLIVTSYSEPGSRAQITVSGPVPGF